MFWGEPLRALTRTVAPWCDSVRLCARVGLCPSGLVRFAAASQSRSLHHLRAFFRTSGASFMRFGGSASMRFAEGRAFPLAKCTFAKKKHTQFLNICIILAFMVF